jgi:glycosyltransferase involved in cell wall biosynthesis
MAKPLISVLTPAYNAAAFLPELIATVAAQEYELWEHVVIDDGSTDETADLLAASTSPHLRWHSRPNRGQYQTQNELIREAKGDIITFICADDLYATPRALSLVAEEFQAFPELDVVFGRTPRLVMAPEGAYTFDPDLPVWMARPLMRHWSCIQHCSVFVRADFVRRNSLYFDPSYQNRGDWDWLIRVFQTGWTGHIPSRLSYWRIHPGQTSQTAVACGQQETARLYQAHKIAPTIAAGIRHLAVAYAQILHSWSIMRRRGFPALLRKAAGSASRRIGLRLPRSPGAL